MYIPLHLKLEHILWKMVDEGVQIPVVVALNSLLQTVRLGKRCHVIDIQYERCIHSCAVHSHLPPRPE